MNDISAQLRDGDSEQRLRLALETGQIGLWVWNSTDLDSVGDWSNRLKAIFGMTPDALVTHEMFLRCVHADDRDAVNRGVMNALAGELAGRYQAEYRIIRVDDGSARWVTARGQAFFDAAGAPVRFIGTVMDITDRKLAEASLERENLELERMVALRTEDLAQSKAFLEIALADKERSESELRSILEAIPTQVWNGATDGAITLLNQHRLDHSWSIAGASDGDGWRALLHSDDRQRFADWWEALRSAETSGEVEVRLRRADGVYYWFLVRALPVRDGSGCLRWYGTNTDIDERKRTEALLAGENRILEMLTAGVALYPILEALCHLGEEVSGGARVSILLVSADGRRLRYGASPSLPKTFTAAIDGLEVGPMAGSCGTAAYRREPVFVADILNDPQWAPYRTLADSCALRSCWSTPIFATTRQVLGTFALYGGTPGMPSAAQCLMVRQFAHLASIAIERAQAREALSRSEAYLAQAQQLSHTGSFGWHLASGRLSWSDETYCILGYPRHLAPTMTLVFERLHPEDVPKLRQLEESVTREPADFELELRIVPPPGSVRHLHVVARLAPREDGDPEFVGAVMDITERVRIEDELRAAERYARGQAEALTRTLEALAREPVADRIVEHVLRTITAQLDAHSCVVWLRGADGGGMTLGYALEDGAFRTHGSSEPASMARVVPDDSVWAWPAILASGDSAAFEDIRHGPDFPWRASLIAQGVVSLLFVPMVVAGDVTGIVSIRFTEARRFCAEEMNLAKALASQARLAVQLMQLAQHSRHAAVVAERNRMARDIHDTLAQGFTGVIVQAEAAQDALSKGLVDEAGQHLARIARLGRDSLGEARRSVRALRPRALEEQDLCAATEDLLAKMTKGTSVVASLKVLGTQVLLPPDTEENLLRIVQEVLTNTLRHAGANGFRVTLDYSSAGLVLDMEDDGRGFDPNQKGAGFGLVGIGERVESMSGTLSIDSAAGAGVRVRIALPAAIDEGRSVR